MVEPEKSKKKKDQIEYDADVAQRLQAELDKEARLEREREEEASKDMDAELVKGSETQESEVYKGVPELAAGSLKRMQNKNLIKKVLKGKRLVKAQN
ncbi:hypothetical protein Tco_1228444 [Tanacetum coccineum]